MLDQNLATTGDGWLSCLNDDLYSLSIWIVKLSCRTIYLRCSHLGQTGALRAPKCHQVSPTICADAQIVDFSSDTSKFSRMRRAMWDACLRRTKDLTGTAAAYMCEKQTNKNATVVFIVCGSSQSTNLSLLFPPS